MGEKAGRTQETKTKGARGKKKGGRSACSLWFSKERGATALIRGRFDIVTGLVFDQAWSKLHERNARCCCWLVFFFIYKIKIKIKINKRGKLLVGFCSICMKYFLLLR